MALRAKRWSTITLTSPTRMPLWCVLIRGRPGPPGQRPPEDVTHTAFRESTITGTKALTASEDGRLVCNVGIGSNSNITERGMEAK